MTYTRNTTEAAARADAGGPAEPVTLAGAAFELFGEVVRLAFAVTVGLVLAFALFDFDGGGFDGLDPDC